MLQVLSLHSLPEICKHWSCRIFAQFGCQRLINTRHKCWAQGPESGFICWFAKLQSTWLGGPKLPNTYKCVHSMSVWLISFDALSVGQHGNCTFWCQISICAMLMPSDRALDVASDSFVVCFSSSAEPCNCTNTQMAVDDNLIGFSSVTLHTTNIISIKLNRGRLTNWQFHLETHPCYRC